MSAKVQGRLVLVCAEAGYGKTTLLSDFARNTRTRVLWYRLDPSDADLPTFLAYLVAAGREHQRSFGDATLSLLAATEAPDVETLVGSFMREVAELSGPTILILDDFHLVDQNQEVLGFISRLLQHAYDQLTLVISTRRRPDLQIGRLRTLGEFAEIGREDLRFQPQETAQLFAEVYGRHIEAGALSDLTTRTEGWVASLQLVEAATRTRTASETRNFIRTLGGAASAVYDFLAEEVVGQLGRAEQDFAMKASLLAVVSPTTASIVSGMAEGDARKSISVCARVGLLSRRGPEQDVYRFHPLVQQFLQHRLEQEIGPEGIRELHLRVGLATEQSDWFESCWHYSAARQREDVARILERAASGIMATGLYSTAGQFVAGAGDGRGAAISALILSRLALANHDPKGATTLARRAVELANVDEVAMGNLVAVLVGSGELAEARGVAEALLVQALDPQIRQVAEVTIGLIDASVSGDLLSAARAALELAQRSVGSGASRYEAIGLLNAGEVWRAIGRPTEALAAASRASDLLLMSESRAEVATASSIRSWALALTDGLDRARAEFAAGTSGAEGSTLIEVLAEFALVEALYGGEAEAARLVSDARSRRLSKSVELSEKIALADLAVLIRQGDVDGASIVLKSIRPEALSAQPGREALRIVLEAHLEVIASSDRALESALTAQAWTTEQGCEWLIPYSRLLAAYLADAQSFDRIIAEIGRDPGTLSPVAELIFRPDHGLSSTTVAVVGNEVLRFPERWRPVLRRVSEDPTHRSRLAAASLLDLVGTREDVPRLRRLAKAIRGADPHRELGKGLARRLAPRVYVEDQGRVSILIGGEEVPSRLVRRKVLALICFLITKPKFSVPRDEVLDALWPDMDPVDALNSLNQTVYFLRRVFEPGFVEDHSPAYISHESELVWLDRELVGSRSADCAAVMSGLTRPPAPSEVEVLCRLYRDRFALDFAYEDWAASYRDTQHAAFLHAVEEAVRLDTASGHFRRGVELARHALSIDSGAAEIEEALLRLYRLEGARAAAAEQYEHYRGAMQRTLDVEVPPLEEL